MKRVILLIIVSLFFITGIAFAQHDIEISIDVAEGNVFQKSNYSSTVVTDNNEIIGDRYTTEFRGIQLYNFSYDHTNDGTTNTKITGGSNFGVPGMRFVEKISTEQVDIDGKDCCGVAAGSKFSVYGVNEFETSASQGGTGACCGVNYNAKVAEGAGTLQFGFIDRRIGEDIIPALEDGGKDTTLYGESVATYEFKTQNSSFGNAEFNVSAPPCSPDAPADPINEGIFSLCPWDTGGFPFSSFSIGGVTP